MLSRIATVREKSGKMRFYSRSGESEGVLYQVREFLNPCSKSGIFILRFLQIILLDVFL